MKEITAFFEAVLTFEEVVFFFSVNFVHKLNRHERKRTKGTPAKSTNGKNAKKNETHSKQLLVKKAF